MAMGDEEYASFSKCLSEDSDEEDSIGGESVFFFFLNVNNLFIML